MPSMKVKINLKTGNVLTEMNGFVDQACVTKALEVQAMLKTKGITVDLDTFHQKDTECPENLVHVMEKATSGSGK